LLHSGILPVSFGSALIVRKVKIYADEKSTFLRLGLALKGFKT